MAITLDGSAGITLPVDLAQSEGGTGVSASSIIVQSVRTDDGEVATGTTVIPNDDTIPQITEGNEFLTITVTPKNALNRLVIEASVNFSSSADNTTHTALFQDTTPDALAAKTIRSAADAMDNTTINHEMVAGAAGAITFRIRCGGASAGTITFNGVSGARRFGGVANSYIKVTEVTP